MPLTLLQIVNRAQQELGYPATATVVGNTDATATQMLALSNRCLDEIRRMNRWTVCQFEFNLVVNTPTITTGNLTANSPIISNLPTDVVLTPVDASGNANYWQVAAQSVPQAARLLSVDSSEQVTMTMEATTDVTAASIVFAQDTYELPSDFDFFQDQSWWDRTNRWQLIGPDSPQQDQFQRSGVVATGPRRHFRQLGPLTNRFRIWPAPVEITSPLQLVFEYLSLNAVAVEGSDTNFAQYFANDTDVPLLDSQAIILGLKYYFWQIKGFNYSDFKNDWLDYLDRLAARDGGAPTLTMAGNMRSILLSSANCQDGDFPGSPSSSS